MERTSGDHGFIEYVVEKYSDMVVRIAYQNLKNQADDEDVTQEVFIKLLKQPDFNDEEHLKAWLIRVTINQCRICGNPPGSGNGSRSTNNGSRAAKSNWASWTKSGSCRRTTGTSYTSITTKTIRFPRLRAYSAKMKTQSVPA